MNTVDDKIQTEKQLTEVLTKDITGFEEALTILNKQLKGLELRKQKFPEKYLKKAADGNYEDLLILASQLKHDSISLHRNTTGMFVKISAELEYYESQILLYFAEEFLKDKGFDKVTDLLRNSYISSNKELKKLKIIKGKYKALEKSAEQLVRAFENDEFNFRKFMDMSNKLKGL